MARVLKVLEIERPGSAFPAGARRRLDRRLVPGSTLLLGQIGWIVTAMNAVRTSPDALPEDTLLPRDTRRALPLALLRAREAVMVRFRPLLAERDMTEQQWRVVRVLGEDSPLDASEVANRACVLAPSLTRIIRALEDRKLITRDRDTGDGRRISLAIAPAGLAMIRELTPEIRLIYAHLEASYGRERMERLLDMLCELAELKE